jgi:hypothetical protein
LRKDHEIVINAGSVAQIAQGDSCRESSVIAGDHEQTDTPDLQDQKLTELQRSAQAPRLADDLVRC